MSIKTYKEKMKLSVVIPVLNQIDLAKTCYKEIAKNTINLGDHETEFIIIDNGSDTPIREIDFPGSTIIRNEKNIGVYPTFKQGMEVSTGEVVAFLHSDVVVWEQCWNMRVVDRFINNKALGLIGFVGSNEIDVQGGRGVGTMSNFQGKTIHDGVDKTWHGSSWDSHGKHIVGYEKGAVVDGCVMILRRDAWNKIGYREDFPPHHFYDRLISTQMLENGYEICVMGIEFDHISGQTVNTEKGYQLMAWEWLMKNKYIHSSFDTFNENYNYDSNVYKIAESKWLEEYRDIKRIIPITI